MQSEEECQNCLRLRRELEEWRELTTVWRRRYGEVSRELAQQRRAPGSP